MILAPTMVEIAASGGGLDIDIERSKILPPAMKDIARAAAGSGKRPTIIFRNVPALYAMSLKDIAILGDGCVIFGV